MTRASDDDLKKYDRERGKANLERMLKDPRVSAATKKNAGRALALLRQTDALAKARDKSRSVSALTAPTGFIDVPGPFSSSAELEGFLVELDVKRHWMRTPYRHPKGTLLHVGFCD